MDSKRKEILTRAAEVYMRLGIRSVTMDDLARELGVSKKTFYKYFSDKNDIVNSVIQSKLEDDKALCHECRGIGENAIEEIIRISMLLLEQLGNLNPAVFYDLKKYYPEAHKSLNDHKWTFVCETIETNIKRGIEEGIYRSNINSEVISRLYVATSEIIMNGEVFKWPDFKIEEILLDFIRYHIRGIANDNGINYLNEKFNHEINE